MFVRLAPGMAWALILVQGVKVETNIGSSRHVVKKISGQCYKVFLEEIEISQKRWNLKRVFSDDTSKRTWRET